MFSEVSDDLNNSRLIMFLSLNVCALYYLYC